MTDVKLNLPDMGCDHCVMTVTKTASELDGVQDVQVDLAAKEADIRYDAAKVSEEQIRAALEEAGYPAT